jgi:NADH-quinone oxidoreductase subunit M
VVSTVFVVTTLASIGLPLLNNFVGEFLILQGAAQARFLYAVLASIGVILSAVYMLWLVQRAFYGETSAEVRRQIVDLRPREWAVIVSLLVMMVWMGVGSRSFLPSISAHNQQTLERIGNPAAGREVAHVR